MKRWAMLAATASLCWGCAGSGNGGFTTNDTYTGAGGGCVYHVYRHDPKGWLLTQPEVHLVGWGTHWQGYQYPGLTDFQVAWNSLFTNGEMDRLAEYGVSTGTVDANTYNTNTTIDQHTDASDAGAQVKLLDDSTFGAEINAEIQAGKLPLPNANTLYVILLPPEISTQSLVNNQWAGYHGSLTYGTTKYTFAIIAYTDMVSMDMVISHEIAEAATNPDGHGWFDDGEDEGEIADLCAWQQNNNFPYTVQKLWSQDICQCL